MKKMNLDKPNNKKLKISSAIVVTLAVVLLSIASGFMKEQQKSPSSIVGLSSTTAIASSSATPKTIQTAKSSGISSSGFKDGTYSAISNYYVPNGSEEIQVSIALKNGIITDSSIKNSENNSQSAQYQEGFASEYKPYVVGKNIANLKLSYVSGASDTTRGFDDALANIITEAKS